MRMNFDGNRRDFPLLCIYLLRKENQHTEKFKRQKKEKKVNKQNYNRASSHCYME